MVKNLIGKFGTQIEYKVETQFMFKYIFFILLLSAGTKSCNQDSKKESTENQMSEKSTNTSTNKNLHDIWALTSMDGQSIDQKKFNDGVPTLEIYLADKRITGFSGCNNYFASIESMDGSNFVLGPIASTKKYCVDVDERAFFEKMNQIESYSLEKMQLSFYRGDSLLLSFKKVD